MKLCDICFSKRAVRFESVVEGGAKFEYGFCEDCYRRAANMGLSPVELARATRQNASSVCSSCGYTAREFEESYMFGCADCYSQMVALAAEELSKINADVRHPRALARISDFDRELVKDYVVSSRVRLARNIRGLPFPKYMRRLAEEGDLTDDERESLRVLLRGAMLAADGIFDGTLFEMSELGKVKKDLLVQSHMISPPLAKSDLGAVIIEKGEDPQISIMLIEEDHIRAQCVKSGLDVAGAYRRLERYSDNLNRLLPIAASEEWGYLTACPTNVGTGMRASVMAFLPALKSLGKLDAVLNGLKARYDITVRGYLGEGSDSAFDMYQISNAHMACVGEEEIVALVENAAFELCAAENVATSELVDAEQYRLTDRLIGSYDELMRATELGERKMCELLADVRLGVRLKMFDIDTKKIDNALDQGLTAFIVMGDSSSESVRSYLRAQIVRECLGAK